MIVDIVIGIIVGFVAGFFFGKIRAYRSAEFSTQLSVMNNLSTQIAEMKGKFEQIEEQRKELDAEREKRFNDFVNNIREFFNQLSEKTSKLDEEKDKRIKELTEHMKIFFEEQKQHTEKFLSEQGKSREEIEQRRDAQIEDMKKMISMFTKTISGTKTRGITGEILLKEALKESIRVGLIKCNLKTDNGEVEFAWDLGDGKYIPIDSKMPDVFEIIEKYETTEDIKKREESRKEIIDKVKKEIKNVQKYQNLTNTIDSCILVVPEAVLDIAPELVSFGKQSNVFVCNYKDVFIIAHALQDQYIRTRKEGDIGKYKQIIENLFQLLDNISAKIGTIERAITTIHNANEEIKTEIIKGKRNKQYIAESESKNNDGK
jgi:DNA recombination protein RmuC